MAAALWHARRLPANSQFLRPNAIGRIMFSMRLFGCQIAVVNEARQRRPAFEAVVDGLGCRAAIGWVSSGWPSTMACSRLAAGRLLIWRMRSLCCPSISLTSRSTS